ncbi:MAG: MraY family glycosyltransferase [Verrucomicrobiota bacterium]
MNWLFDIAVFLTSLIVSGFLVRIILQYSARWIPARRHHDFHHNPEKTVPRIGGIVLAVPFLIVSLLIGFGYINLPWGRDQTIIAAGAMAMFLLGLADDFHPLGARKKLLGQLLIATAVYSLGLGIQTFMVPFKGTIIHLGLWSLPITLFWLVAITNIVNLIDGVDGLAGGICLMLLVLLVYVGREISSLQLICYGLIGALLGFLRFNFPPARIYMGDGGAYFLGFFIAAATIANSQKGTITGALAAPMFGLALPILDASFAILRRGLRGLPIFRPDRRHIHHRLLEMGLSRKKVVLWLYGFTMIFLTLGFVAILLRGEWIPVLAGFGALVILVAAGKLSFSREWFAVGRVLNNSLSMRADVQYALRQTRWLLQESRRSRSVESMWQDFVFIGQKLGFTYIQLKLEDSIQVWVKPNSCANFYQASYPLHVANCADLNLKVCLCSHKDSRFDYSACANGCCRYSSLSAYDKKVFGITGEILMESWEQCLKTWTRINRLPPRFDSRIIETEDAPIRRWVPIVLPKPSLVGQK